MAGYHVIVEAEHSVDEPVAAEIARALCEAYPGHPWHVNIIGGVIVIKNMRFSAKWAMVREYGLIHDATKLKHECVMAAGEFLERARVRRGAATGERVVSIDGIPKKDLIIG